MSGSQDEIEQLRRELAALRARLDLLEGCAEPSAVDGPWADPAPDVGMPPTGDEAVGGGYDRRSLLRQAGAAAAGT